MEMFALALIPALPFIYVPDISAVILARRMCVAFGAVSVVALAIGAVYSAGHALAGAGRLSTDVINPITVGDVGASLFIVCLAHRGPSAKLRFSRLLAGARIVGGLLGTALCLLTASKGPLLGLMLAAFAMLLQRLSRLSSRRRALEIALAACLVGALLAGAALLAQSGLLLIYSRFSDIASDQSTALRLQAWDGALAQYDSAPLWGSSAVELSTRFYPHNLVVEVMMATGAFGLLLLLLLLAMAGAASWRILRTAPEYSWIALLFLQQLVSSMLSGSAYFGGQFWISMAILLGLRQMIRGRPGGALFADSRGVEI
jgi:O-antigen ligase